MGEDTVEAREKARIGLKKVMSGEPGEQRQGNELIEKAASLAPDAVEDVSREVRDHAKRLSIPGR